MRLASSFAGQFYPGQPEELKETVERLLADASAPVSGEIVGALVPHAGYVYSGRTAALAVGALRDRRPSALVLLGPSHRLPVDGARVFRVDGFETPVGPVASDPDLAHALAEELEGVALAEPFPEHSLEVQLPLLARALPGVPVVEMAFGPADFDLSRRVAARLASLGEEQELLVLASSDLSHYYEHRTAQQLDGRFREILESGDSHRMWAALCQREVEACGAGPLLVLMELARVRDARFRVVDQTDSSRAFGDTDRVVGYLSALVLGEGRR